MLQNRTGKELIFCHVIECPWTGFRLVIECIQHLQNVITINYSAIANSYTLQFTIARTKSSQYAVFSLVVT
jgi:hypothetical protein